MRNPFTPNFGQAPYVMAGRDALLDEVSSAFENGPGDPALTSVIVGARGTGKTALLSAIAADAQQRGWLAVNVPCVKGMLEEIIQGAYLAAEKIVDVEERSRLKAISVGQVFGVEWEREQRESPTWLVRMSALLDRLGERNLGLAITVDEVRPSLEEMVLLASYHQLFVRDERKVALFMAGLPSEVSSLLNNESVSFLRRACHFPIGRICEEDARRAFGETAQLAGKAFDEDALARAIRASEGFPFMIQLVGYRSWQEVGESPLIDDPSVARGVKRAANDMKTRVLKATLDEVSERDLDYLEAMLADEVESRTGDIARRMGESEGYASQYRRRLVERGIIGARGRGKVAFDLPLLREYLPEYLALR